MNELGFTETWLLNHFTPREYFDFMQFMRGQTIAQVNNQNTYYYYDVQNYCSQYGVRYPIDKKS